jgi:DNA-binding NarL/FixJ family response regulator
MQLLNAITRTTTTANKALAERDRLILKARKQGLTVRQIAQAADIAPQTVLNIVARHHDKQPA